MSQNHTDLQDYVVTSFSNANFQEVWKEMISSPILPTLKILLPFSNEYNSGELGSRWDTTTAMYSSTDNFTFSLLVTSSSVQLE